MATDTKARYSDAELDEFKKLIEVKINKAQEDLELRRSDYMNAGTNGTYDTSPTFHAVEEGSETMSKEANTQLAIRQVKFIRDLKHAIIRIENKTYGVCRVTGKLINKTRLLLVPHATLSIEAKNMQKQAVRFNLSNINLPTAFIVVLTLLLIDQASKFYIKLNFELSSYGADAIVAWGFFKLLFVENKGIAMGAKLNDFLPFINDKTAKLGLTIFRLFAIIGIGYWLLDYITK